MEYEIILYYNKKKKTNRKILCTYLHVGIINTKLNLLKGIGYRYFLSLSNAHAHHRNLDRFQKSLRQKKIPLTFSIISTEF